MKKQIPKILIVISLLILQQVVSAQSYQRWIVWVKPTSHEVTSPEMADIVSALYNGLIQPNQQYRLSTGVVYTIPNPKTFLNTIERCVKAARPSADTPQEVIDAIAEGEKRPWGNDYSLKTKNYWYSTKDKAVVYNDNYLGIGMNTDFLWIDGTPTIKCDCGNGQEVIAGQTVVRKKEVQEIQTNSISYSEQPTLPTLPTTTYDLVMSRVPTESVLPTSIPATTTVQKTVVDWVKVAKIGGFTIGTALLTTAIVAIVRGLEDNEPPPVQGRVTVQPHYSDGKK